MSRPTSSSPIVSSLGFPHETIFSIYVLPYGLEFIQMQIQNLNGLYPELIVYNAETDILEGDALGRLRVSPDGVKQRDEMVFQFARDQNSPIVMLTSGGYIKTSAHVIADSITNLASKQLISLPSRSL